MKIMWLCSSILQNVEKSLNIKSSLSSGWIVGYYNKIIQNSSIELIYLFPSKTDSISLEDGNCTFVSYPQKEANKLEKNQVQAFEELIKKHSPDVIHIFGSEYPHTYAMMLAGKNTGTLNKMIIHIQGLSYVVAKHFEAGLPWKVVHSYTFRDLIRSENVYQHKKSFEKRGYYEIEALKLAKHVMGRTDWDYACVKRINPDIQYHACNETLRDIFYTESWNLERCERHSVFVSQCSYSIKGFHLMIEAMADIVKRYPDAQLYTTGKNLLAGNWKEKLRQKYYHKYISDLISQYGLEKNVHFVGNLSAEEMCERICRSHVCVCSSSVENSSNFMGESMLVGTPVVASCVGGIQTLLKDGEEGYIYQFDAPYMLAHYVMRIFENDEIARKFSENGRIRAAKTHNREVNFSSMMEIYDHIHTEGEKA